MKLESKRVVLFVDAFPQNAARIALGDITVPTFDCNVRF